MILNKIYYKLKIDRIIGRLLSFIDKVVVKKLNIMNVDTTVAYIIKNQCSVARFGDGELHIATEGCSIGFQKADINLKHDLNKILKNTMDDLLVCLPSPINDYSYMTDDAQKVWREDLKYNRHRWNKIIRKDLVYGDTQFTRPYIDYLDRSQSLNRFNNIKKIWEGRDVILIEGETSRLGVNNDLFKGVNSLKRLLCPAKDAYSSKNKIIDAISSYPKTYLLLIALGPTATVLAYDFCELGFQVVDIGHIDIEYEWCIMKAKEKTQIKSKFTNEVSNNIELDEVVNEEYHKQIVGRIQ